MSNAEDNAKMLWRSLLTETLPYEVPLIFSNDTLFASLVRDPTDESTSACLRKLRTKRNSFTKPYGYTISKDDNRFTSLAIIHPNHQLQIAEFYSNYSRTIIDYCNRSEMSLRRPISEVSLLSSLQLLEQDKFKNGIPHVDPADGEIDVAHVPSYFTYGKYNLLGKCVDSHEFRRLEKRFTLVRTLDVSKCFFNIYTHSITWAVKNKEFAKANSDVYSFEGRFDKLMQRANYNETNGIVVGPEISRIFAEIVLQDIDRRLQSCLTPDQHEVHYAVRRYVDDYYIFASSEQSLDRVESVLRSELEKYKLFLNTHKTSTMSRPFVSAITLARSELGGLISAMHAALDRASETEDASQLRREAREIRRCSLNIRLISQRYDVSFSALSGWLLTTLRILIKRAVAMIESRDHEDAVQALTDMTSALLDISFYIVAMDLRVRSTYSLCQIVALVVSIKAETAHDARDRLVHIVSEELSGLIRTRELSSGTIDDAVELQNLLIIGAHYFKSEFVRSALVTRILRMIVCRKGISYFWYISCKFCLLKDTVVFLEDLKALNKNVAERVQSKDEVQVDAELYLLACDYLSAPDIDKAEKRVLLTRLVGGQPSNEIAAKVGMHSAFADWTGVRIEHLLQRKELRPVYSWT